MRFLKSFSLIPHTHKTILFFKNNSYQADKISIVAHSTLPTQTIQQIKLGSNLRIKKYNCIYLALTVFIFYCCVDTLVSPFDLRCAACVTC